MAVAVQLWGHVAPALHRVVAEEVVAVDSSDSTEGEDAPFLVPDVVRHHVGGGGDTELRAVETAGDEAREPLVGVVVNPTVHEDHVLVVFREFRVGDEVAGALHVFCGFKRGEVVEREEQPARVFLHIDDKEACVGRMTLIEITAVLDVVAVARHEFVQTTVTERGGVASVPADGVDGEGEERFFLWSEE